MNIMNKCILMKNTSPIFFHIAWDHLHWSIVFYTFLPYIYGAATQHRQILQRFGGNLPLYQSIKEFCEPLYTNTTHMWPPCCC